MADDAPDDGPDEFDLEGHCPHGVPGRHDCSVCEAEDADKVDCDDNCGAKKEPQTIEELRAAVEHWRDHRLLSGCSHSR